MYQDVTIVIPTISFNNYLLQCVTKIKQISNLIKIIIVSDNRIDDAELLKFKFIKIILNKKKLTISKKRNIGVHKAKTNYIGFIDSDAYPHKHWIKNSIKILRKDKNIFLVGGPNVSPPDQNYLKTLVSDTQKSFLISGKWAFQKRLSKSRYTENLYSCNMVTKREYFIFVKGMNDKLIAGEDYDFCQRIRKIGKKVYFNKSSIVFHHDRSIKNFFIQKIIRGYTIVEQIKKKSIVFKNNIKEFIFYQLIPLYFFLFNLLSISYFFSGIRNNYISNVIILIYIFYLILLLISTRYNEKNILNYPFILLLIFLGNLSIGFGSLISIFGLNNIINYYKNI